MLFFYLEFCTLSRCDHCNETTAEQTLGNFDILIVTVEDLVHLVD